MNNAPFLSETRAAKSFPADPHCVICDGLGVRHSKPKRVGMFVRRDPCPCTILGPLMPKPQPALAPEPQPEPAFPSIEPCALSLATVQMAMCPTAPRTLSELPPIKEIPMHDPYPNCQPRTPIDPVGKILSPGLMRGNTDLMGSNWNPPKYRECTVCGGRGVGQALPSGGNKMCLGCGGAGTVKL